MASGLFRRWKKGFHPFKEQENEFEKGTGPKRFSYRELAVATNNFSDQLVLGQGAFGSVYKGFLQDMSLAVAIKRVSKIWYQGRREYATEVRVISRLRHRHLMQLVGWCHGGDELLLVYEFMPNGSLDKHLHSANMSPLPWPCRHKVVLGIASAILYLHEDAEQSVVHRDIKPSNVMLDASINAKLGDFGLARPIDHDRDSHSTAIMGTVGYIDPECIATGSSRVTVKSDIYSFGVLLLEIACGRRPIVAMGEEVVYLVKWVRESYGRGIILDAADARLNGEFDVEEMERVMVVGLWCTEPDESLRPSIRRVVNVLRSEAPLPSLPARYAFDYTSSIATGGSGSTGTTQSTEAVNMLQSEVPSQMPVATFLPPPDVFDCSSSLATGASSSGGGRSTGTLFIGDHNPIGGLQMDSEEHARDLLESMLLDASVEPTDMPLSLLKSITNNFSNDRQIGVGGFAVVYKGLLRNGAVAVKKLTKTLDVHEAKFKQEMHPKDSNG
ncbi:hypothetical protein PR202_ga11903 [Eleusine coracana subsp. coracana]|uniref:Protein kinase domain-containing protein n=1 Tax=Eleusine coracana subsp. coracana TaxID=191504 RepID=A0AAV5CAS0_ELECO|nr:hypothetical protein PR202_ga11903 [Eleusine coracana subsp. coracana]